MKYLIIYVLMAVWLLSCIGGRNLQEAKLVSKNFTREYTGIDTLIRIDGYYYHLKDDNWLITPFIISNNREVQYFPVRSDNHIQIQVAFNTYGRIINGSYSLSGDTIKIKWAFKYDLGCYEIYSEKFLIVNDTTLRRIWYLCETCIQSYEGQKHSPIRNEIFKFHKFPN